MAANMKEEIHLVGLYTRYSSWTARIEALIHYFHIPHTSTMVSFPDIKAHSPSGQVPVLLVPSLSLTIPDSLSIAEFLAESFPALPLWPRDRKLRALARSAVAEMHSSFSTLKTYDTNFIAKYTGPVPITPQARAESAKMLALWTSARKGTIARLAELGEADEGFLFGGFSIADAFFWPVLWRFRTYGLPLETANPEALAWMSKMWAEPAMKDLAKDYFRQAERPETLVAQYDDLWKGNAEIVFGRFEEDWEFVAPGKQVKGEK